jgi:lipase chaperone LimK
MAHASFVDALLESRLVMALACAGAVTVGVVGVVLWQRPAMLLGPAPGPRPVAAASWDGPVGPGLLSSPVHYLPATGIEAEVMRGTKIAVDTAGHLVPDAALRQLMDAFLVNGRRSERQVMSRQLRDFLRASLGQPAAGEADRLVTDYLAYLATEEQMLGRERFERPDPAGLSDHQLEQLMAWQSSRAELRQRMLGTTVARAWFEQDDSNCSAAFEDWRKMRMPPETDQEPDSVELAARRRFGPALEERRNNNAQACAAQVMQTMTPRGRQ